MTTWIIVHWFDSISSFLKTYCQPQQQLNSEFIITPQLTTSHDFMFKFKVEVWKTIYTYNQRRIGYLWMDALKTLKLVILHNLGGKSWFQKLQSALLCQGHSMVFWCTLAIGVCVFLLNWISLPVDDSVHEFKMIKPET